MVRYFNGVGFRDWGLGFRGEGLAPSNLSFGVESFGLRVWGWMIIIQNFNWGTCSYVGCTPVAALGALRNRIVLSVYASIFLYGL